jgi:hypothetical protein
VLESTSEDVLPVEARFPRILRSWSGTGTSASSEGALESAVVAVVAVVAVILVILEGVFSSETFRPRSDRKLLEV